MMDWVTPSLRLEEAMGGGSKRPNTQAVPRRSSDLMTTDGGLALSCPEVGRALLRGVVAVRAGARGELRLAGEEVGFFVRGKEMGIIAGPEAELIARCLD